MKILSFFAISKLNKYNNKINHKNIVSKLLFFEIPYEPSINKFLNLNLLVDDIVKFNRYEISIKLMKQMKFIKFLSLRVGISKNITKELCKHLGIHNSIFTTYIPYNINIYKLRSFFLLNKSFLDIQIKNYIIKRIKNLIALKTLKGLKHLWGYPVRGQRTRTNANSSLRCKLLK
jgi:ribosomal protein S13